MEGLIKQLEKSFIEISELIQNSSSNNLENYIEKYNISGDDVKQIDILSNIILKENLSKCSLIRAIGSEEEKELVYTEHNDAPYLICYDPLDGSSNIGVNITTGTIFGVYRYNEDGEILSGRSTVMAGYCLYGGATQYVIANEGKVSMYQYKPINSKSVKINESITKKFVLIQDNLTIPEKGKIYSFNEANRNKWMDTRYQKIIDLLLEKGYSARWVGSMVADGHRTLLKGGFFSYPANSSNTTGKIRLLYEAYPFAFIFEAAGGKATNGDVPLLDIKYPKHNCHLKTPIVLCSPYEMLYFHNLKDEYE